MAKNEEGVLLPTPECRDDYEGLKRTKAGGDLIIYKVNIVAPREGNEHRRIFALLSIAFNNQSNEAMIFNNKEAFREELLKKAGHFFSYTNYKGIKTYKAKSISYDKLDQVGADQVYNALVDVVLAEVLIGSTKKDIDIAVEVAKRF